MGGEPADYVREAFRALHPLVRAWQSETDARARLRADIDQHLVWTRELEKARSFHEYLAKPGTKPRDFRQCEVDLGGGRHAILGLRYRGGRDGVPNVQLCARDFPVTRPEEVHALVHAARSRYSKFDPAWLRCQLGSHERWLDDAGVDVLPDQRFLAGLVSDLQARERPDACDRVTLERQDDTAFYAEYRQSHDELHASSAFHRENVSVQSEEDFAKAAAHGLTFRAVVGGESAGFIAALPCARYGMRGYLALELFLHAPFRGRGLAPGMQRHLIEQMDPAGQALFFGEIDPRNVASVATARRSGRVDVGGNVWVVI